MLISYLFIAACHERKWHNFKHKCPRGDSPTLCLVISYLWIYSRINSCRQQDILKNTNDIRQNTNVHALQACYSFCLGASHQNNSWLADFLLCSGWSYWAWGTHTHTLWFKYNIILNNFTILQYYFIEYTCLWQWLLQWCEIIFSLLIQSI